MIIIWQVGYCCINSFHSNHTLLGGKKGSRRIQNNYDSNQNTSAFLFEQNNSQFLFGKKNKKREEEDEEEESRWTLSELWAGSSWKAATSRKSVIRRRGSRVREASLLGAALVTTRMRGKRWKRRRRAEEKNLNESDSSRRSGGQSGIRRCDAASFACVTSAWCETAAAAAAAAADAPPTSSGKVGQTCSFGSPRRGRRSARAPASLMSAQWIFFSFFFGWGMCCQKPVVVKERIYYRV